MKRILMAMATTALGLALSAGAQQPAQGRVPPAWGDKDKDGKCDMTGKPVGQGRQGMQGQQGMQGRAMGRGRGMRGMQNTAMMRRGGMGRQGCQGCGRMMHGQNQAPAPDAEKK